MSKIYLLQIRTPGIFISDLAWKEAIAQKEGCVGGWVSSSNYGFSYFIAPNCTSDSDLNRLNHELAKTGIDTASHRYIGLSLYKTELMSLGITLTR